MQIQREPSGTSSDRRAHPRLQIARPCKVHDPRTGKYHLAQTRDLSAGGVSIEVDRPLTIKPGEELFIGIAQKRRQTLLRADEMIRIQVVRAMETLSGSTMLAGCWSDASIAAGELRKAA